jgi:hypothetical protein
VEEVGLARKRVISLSTMSKAIDAFKQMDKYHLSGIAIVDTSNRLVGNTSATDLKVCAGALFESSSFHPFVDSLFSSSSFSTKASSPSMSPSLRTYNTFVLTKIQYALLLLHSDLLCSNRLLFC